MALNTQTLTNKIYSPQGASVVGGARGGNFYVPNVATNPGIEIGNVYATYLKLNNIFSVVQLATQSVPANSSVYIQLSNLTLPAGVTYVDGKYLQLEWGKALQLVSTEPDVTWMISGYDLYDEKLTYGHGVSGGDSPYDDTTTRCFYRVSSIKITNNSNSASTITVNIAPSLELPFYNFGTGSHLIAFNYNITSSTSNSYTLNGMQAESSDADSPITWEFTINNPSDNPLAPGLTQSTGTTRPWLSLVETTSENTVFEILIKQIVYGYGTLPNWVVNDRPTLSNNKISIIGGEQYSTDWVQFQG